MDRLRELRKEKGLTTTALANIVGCSNPTITHYEKGDRKPDPDMLKKLADYFEVSVDYLLGRTDKKDFGIKKSPPTESVRDDNYYLQLLLDAGITEDFANSLTDAAIDNIRAYVKGIMDSKRNKL